MYLSHAQTAKAKTILTFWMAHGYTFPQACAWLAMALGESSLNERAIGDHEHSFGLLQLKDVRCAAIKAATGLDIRRGSVEEQLAGVLWEISENGPEHPTSIALKKAETIADACAALVYHFERPANKLAAVAKRTAFAEEFAVMFKDMAA